MGSLLRIIRKWFHCPHCEAKEAMIAFLERKLADVQRREQSAIDHLLAYQGKPEIRETHLSKSHMDRLLNPFAEDYPDQPKEKETSRALPKSIFDDIHGLKD